MTTINFQYLEGAVAVIGQSDRVTLYYNSMFDDENSLKEKNKITFLTFQQLVVEKDYRTIVGILTDNALRELHPSVIFAAIMTVEMVEGIDDAKLHARRVFDLQKVKYQ